MYELQMTSKGLPTEKKHNINKDLKTLKKNVSFSSICQVSILMFDVKIA